jgi:DNA-binding transcriptional MocR family regulator
VSALVLDAGALVAIDRDDRDVHKAVRDAHRMGVPVRTNSMTVAQVWRDSRGRQAELARVLRGVTIQSVTPEDGRRAGELLATTGSSDAIDATVALLAQPGDRILTSDPSDLRALCEAAGNRARVVSC